MNDGYTFGEFYIPARMMSSVTDYIKHGAEPGRFLAAVICNDLKEAVAWADEENMRNLPAYAAYFYNKAPGLCWGSRERMLQWIQEGGGLRRPGIETP